MRTLLNFLFALPFIVLIVIIAVINARLLLGPSSTPSEAKLLKQLRSLKTQINKGADEEMQRLYPEGYVFLNALYGLAWCNYAKLTNHNEDTYAESQLEINSALRRLQSEKARATFSKHLSPEHGAFYQGWTNYVLAKKLEIEPEESRRQEVIATFKANCDSIAKAFIEKTYPLSYGAAAWPADAAVCMATLAKHDDLFGSKYEPIIQKWIDEVKDRYDENSMIPHSVAASNGKPTESARGSSQSLMLIFLTDIDNDFANQHYEKFRQHFIDTSFGLTGIREYPKGKSGFGDVDSGPVIFGYGAAATIVGMSALSVFDDPNARLVSATVDAVGIPIESSSERYYLLGFLPIADAFIAWGQSVRLQEPSTKGSFVAFHLYSAVMLLILAAIVWIFIKPTKADSAKALTIPW
ncbi:hypothetical protein WBG78_03285 [Chryseolinea sp. T2]|uniref:hypothetical protein n=1 Tax=Chryseolinea sp. T2 TaxID=3129255 RepID=UPI00307696A8